MTDEALKARNYVEKLESACTSATHTSVLIPDVLSNTEVVVLRYPHYVISLACSCCFTLVTSCLARAAIPEQLIID